MNSTKGVGVTVRLAHPETELLWKQLFRRYPRDESATLARFGWRETREGLVVTLTSFEFPGAGDIDDGVSHVSFHEPYTLRVALAAESHPFAVGVVHSHPEGCRTEPSAIDDDMDCYFAEHFAGFAPDRPYVSLIFAQNGARLSATGRVRWHGTWYTVERFSIEGDHATIGGYVAPTALSPAARARVARLESALGKEAAERLARSTVAVIGAGGTASPALEVLARAGVGHLMVVDPDIFEASNLERVHGSGDRHVDRVVPKAVIAKEHILSINPDCQVTAIQGRLPQPDVVDSIVTADVLIGCTDQQHSRLALSDVAVRYLVPAIECNVTFEGNRGRITGQVIQLVRFLPSDPCALCRNMTDPTLLAQELMSDEEREQRRIAARRARARGHSGSHYWVNQPQLNTVGYLTTAAGGMAAGYAIGWLTGTFEPPFERLQMNLSQPYFDVTDSSAEPQEACACRKIRGTADQGQIEALLSAPPHWPAPSHV